MSHFEKSSHRQNEPTNWRNSRPGRVMLFARHTYETISISTKWDIDSPGDPDRIRTPRRHRLLPQRWRGVSESTRAAALRGDSSRGTVRKSRVTRSIYDSASAPSRSPLVKGTNEPRPE